MVALTLLVLSIAIADSVNPSTVVPALWQAGAPRGRGLASLTLGVFVVYLAAGVALAFGPGPALIHALHHVGGTFAHALEAGGGMLALALAVSVWRSRDDPPDDTRLRRCRTRASAFAFGAGIMAVELPTAFMYFGAISAILSAHPVAVVSLSLLIAYNALFVTPLVAIIAIRLLAGERGDRWLAAGESWLRGAGRLALDGGALMDVGCYCVNAARLIAGEPQRVSAEQVLGGDGVDIAFAATMRFPDDVLALFDAGLALDSRDELEVVGEEGSLCLDDPWHCRTPLIELRRGDGVERIEIPVVDSYRLEAENMGRRSGARRRCSLGVTTRWARRGRSRRCMRRRPAGWWWRCRGGRGGSAGGGRTEVRWLRGALPRDSSSGPAGPGRQLMSFGPEGWD
ncbi:MAG: GAP family protein [Actinomycetota bacterium]|nr:GAP family protein [Actinomycetota bacterium]